MLIQALPVYSSTSQTVSNYIGSEGGGVGGTRGGGGGWESAEGGGALDSEPDTVA